MSERASEETGAEGIGDVVSATESTRRSGTAAGKRFGYVVAIIVNIALIVVANNLLAWDFLPFLTDRFTSVLPLLNLSLGVSIGVNAIYLFWDPPMVKSVGQILVNAAGLAATVRMYQVFPFDFSAYRFNWTAVTRAVLIVAMVGSAIGIIVETARAARAATGSKQGRPA